MDVIKEKNGNFEKSKLHDIITFQVINAVTKVALGWTTSCDTIAFIALPGTKSNCVITGLCIKVSSFTYPIFGSVNGVQMYL